MPIGPNDSLDIATLSSRYSSGEITVRDVMAEVQRRIDAYSDPAIWIYRLSERDLRRLVEGIEGLRDAGKPLPLYGIPFGVKDNIDIESCPTTAACKAFSHVATRTASVCRKLGQAGAILIGKTNLDQFATGLVGVRSPYGVPKNPLNPEYITGGSSSGSAVAVSAGLVSFSLGTDTAGSGRVPAAFNNIVGHKPTRGLLSCAGVVPACKSLDCVSIFSLTCADAALVAEIAEGFDPDDPYSRPKSEIPERAISSQDPKFGIPRPDQLNFFDNAEYRRLYEIAVGRMTTLGYERVVINFEPFMQAGKLLYDGPWVAERVAGLWDFLKDHSNELLPVTAKIFSTAASFSAADTFAALHRLSELDQASRKQWAEVDLLLLPTAGTIYTQAQIAADPIQLNKNLGYFTQFVNLLDLCAVAVPAGFTKDKLPFGITLMGRAGQDEQLLQIADRFHREQAIAMGATHNSVPGSSIQAKSPSVLLAVVGAHLTGQPLNWQLTQRGARLVRATKTADCYQLFALANTMPPKPGLVRVEPGRGASIELEVWELTNQAFGSFVADVPSPMVIGTVQLDDGSQVKGFLCEPAALAGAQDITHLGGWRAYLDSNKN
jgi:allophanate hydrolase